MFKSDSLWNRANVCPADWVGILEVELELQGRKATQKNCLHWLEANGSFTDRFALSRIKRQHLCAVSLSDTQEQIVQTIINGVSLRSCIRFFEEAAYRSLKFYIPEGNPDSVKSQSRPEGFYQATRFSISEPNKLIRSVFYFYRNPAQHEHLAGYADNLTIQDVNKPSLKRMRTSNVLRFRELRLIDRDSGHGYQIISHGFVFCNRQCFIVTGASFETKQEIHDDDLKMSDIRHVQSVYYILDDDNDANRIRGIKSTFLRHEGNPASCVIELNRINNLKYTQWRRLLENDNVQIGVFDPVDIDTDLLERLEVSADDRFKVLRVKSTTSTP